MRKIIFLISFLITSICATAQMDANWLWGDSLGIKFSSGTIIPIESSIKTVESAASISDSSGNLLFYSDGQHVYNKLNQSLLKSSLKKEREVVFFLIVITELYSFT